jgi:hypothetical protein
MKTLPSATTGSLKCTQFGNLLFTGVELSPGLRIEREQREMVDRSGAIFGGGGIVVDFVLRAGVNGQRRSGFPKAPIRSDRKSLDHETLRLRRTNRKDS